MKSTVFIVLMHLMVGLTTAATLGHLNYEAIHHDWHTGKYITKLQNPGNDCDDGAWGFVAIDGEVHKTDHRVCNVTSLHKNMMQWHADTTGARTDLDKRIPNPVIVSGTVSLVGGSTISGTITLGTVVSLAAIGAAVGGILFGIAWVGKKIVNTINSRDVHGDVESRQVKKGMYLLNQRGATDEKNTLVGRGSEDVAVCVTGNNDDEDAEGDDKSNRDVDNSMSTQCAQDINDAGAAGGECGYTFTADDGSVTNSQEVLIADASVDYNSACCKQLAVC
ncbi:unnamed protein product [Sympodiomycopsis kandeliae]